MLPLEHGYALIGQLLTSLYSGSSVYFMHNDILPNYIRVMNLQQITIAWSVPALLRILGKSQVSVNSVRILGNAGAPYPFDLHEDLKRVFPNSTVINNYGGTEASPRLSFINDNDPKFLEGSVGKPLPGTKISIITGRLAFSGPGLMLGYYEDSWIIKLLLQMILLLSTVMDIYTLLVE